MDGSDDVAAYSDRLAQLEQQCETRNLDQLSKDIAGAVAFARDAGHEMAALQLMNAMSQGLQSDTSKSLSCREAAQFIVSNTVQPGSVSLTPGP